MSRLRSSSDIRSQAVASILSSTDPRGGTAPFAIEEKRNAYLAATARAGDPAAVACVTDHDLQSEYGPIAIRVYEGSADSSRVVLYLHGGGFVSGNLDTHDPVCRSLASGSGCVVIAVDYRLAPEHPYPAALDDARAAARWVGQRWPGARVIVGGDSAGGNLAAVLALWAHAERLPLAGQILIYPVLDATLAGASLVENALIPPFTLLDYLFIWQQYLGPEVDRRNPQVSPLRAPALNGLPKTFLLTAEFDILRSEGAAYAQRLRESGVPVDHWDVPGMTHGFVQWAATVPEAREALDRIAAFISSL